MSKVVHVGDEIVTIKPLWHMGVDIGDRLGRVINVTGHVIVELYDYENNPVKCFRYEIEVVHRDKYSEFEDNELDEFINGLWSKQP